MNYLKKIRESLKHIESGVANESINSVACTRYCADVRTPFAEVERSGFCEVMLTGQNQELQAENAKLREALLDLVNATDDELQSAIKQACALLKGG